VASQLQMWRRLLQSGLSTMSPRLSASTNQTLKRGKRGVMEMFEIVVLISNLVVIGLLSCR